MTLIVGIKCQTGIVLGSDSAATQVTSTGQQTATQPTDKFDIIDDTIILGVSGQCGYSQAYRATIAKLWKELAFSNKSRIEVRNIISAAIREHLLRETQFANAARGSLLGEVANLELVSHTLVAMPVKKEPVLFEFTATGAPEEKTEKLPTVAIGSAQQIADPFLSFLRRVFWPDRLPTIGEGKLATYWALNYSIKAAPGNVGEPIKIVTLESSDGKVNVDELDEQELAGLGSGVADAEKHLKAFGGKLPKAEVVKPPEPAG